MKWLVLVAVFPFALLGCNGEGATPEKVSAPATAEPPAGWKHYKHTDKFDDSTSFIAELPAKAEGRAAAETPVLIAICDGRRNTNSLIDWRRFIGVDKVFVASRLDKNPARYEESSVSSDNQATYMPDAEPKLKELLQEGKFLIASVHPDGGAEIFAEFDLAGAADALKDIRAACNW